MKRFKCALLAVWLVASSGVALAQNAVLQQGPWTPGHVPAYANPGSSTPTIQDSGGSGGGPGPPGPTGPTGPSGSVNATYDIHAHLVSGVTTPTGPSTVAQSGFYAIGDGGSATYIWNATSYCPGGTFSLPVTADGIVCILPSGQNPVVAGRYILQAGVNVDVRSVGMLAEGQDNSPYLSALLTANGPNLRNSTTLVNTGIGALFPMTQGLGSTEYYFSSAFDWSRTGRIDCGGSGAQSGATLVFAPGVDGVVQDAFATSSDGGGANNNDINGCSIVSLGFGNGGLTNGGSSITNVTMEGYGSIPATTWGIGDGVIVAAYNGWLNVPQTPTAPDTGMLGVTNGAWISGVSGSGNTTILTLSSGYTGIAQSTLVPNTCGMTGGVICFDLIRLPAALAYTATTTQGSNSVSITAGPSPSLLRVGDWIWSDVFPMGAAIRTITGSGYPYTITIYDIFGNIVVNATAPPAGTGGTRQIWRIPAGIDRRTIANAHNDWIHGWALGEKMFCSTTYNILCTGSIDENNAFHQNLIGKAMSGNNTGASVSIGNKYNLDTIYDRFDGAFYPDFAYGENTNSGESGSTGYAEVGGCGATGVVFFGGYLTWNTISAPYYPSWPCLPPASNNGGVTTNGGIGPGQQITGVSGPVVMFNEAHDPEGMIGWNIGQQFGTWKYVTTAPQAIAATSAANNAITFGSTIYWAYPGLTVTDETQPTAIPTNTVIASVNYTTNTIYLSKWPAATVNATDVIAIGTGVTASAPAPCMVQQYGVQLAFNESRDSLCGNGVSGSAFASNLQLWYNGPLDAWAYAMNRANGLLPWGPLLAFAPPVGTSSKYAGYNPYGSGGAIAAMPSGITLSNPTDFNHGLGAGVERALDAGAAAPTVTTGTFTAADWFTTNNSWIAVASCPASIASVSPQIVDTTVSATAVLGSANTCVTTGVLVTLTGAASAASLSAVDTLTFAGGAVINSADWWTTNNTTIFLSGVTCTNVAGAVTDTSNGGASVGTVSTCVMNAPVLKLANQSNVNSSGGTDALTYTSRLKGDVRLNVAAVPGANAGWINTLNASGFRPFGIVQDTIPAISSCGTGTPSVTANSTNLAGKFTLGTGTPTACTITFANAYPTAAFCTVTPASSGAAAITGGYYLSAMTKALFTLTLGTGTSSAVFTYTCGGN